MLKYIPLWFWFLLAIFAATAAIPGLSWWLSNACQYVPLETVQITQPNGGQNHTDPAKHDQQAANESNNVSQAAPVSVNQILAAESDPESSERHGQWEQESWWGKFWCDVKASDAAVAFFTLILAIVGFFAFFSATSVARELERAYVSGGGPWIRDGAVQAIVGFQLTADNYGKSPAMLIGYAVEVCEFQNLPLRPHLQMTPFRNTIKPVEKGLPIRNRTYPSSFADPVAYGRIWYRDIWRREHHFSFILTTDATDHSHVSGVHQDYTEWT